ncbi:MAG: phosphoadenylyl-sulfate reductase [Pseudorhodoplanes sp.]
MNISEQFKTSGRDALREQRAFAARMNGDVQDLAPADRLAHLRSQLRGRIVLTTSFGIEDQVILHFAHARGLAIDVVTLDTGRLFPETYALWAETERRYGHRIQAIYPKDDRLAVLVHEHGINGFYDSVEARIACCQVRKVEPLGRALAGAKGWITGLRADQSRDRVGAGIVSVDAHHRVIKFNPLFDWTRDMVVDFARAHDVPVNPLHDQGFVSIGCAPCTRAIAPGEPERAGRWWWEESGKKECGLHWNSGRPSPVAHAEASAAR